MPSPLSPLPLRPHSSLLTVRRHNRFAVPLAMTLAFSGLLSVYQGILGSTRAIAWAPHLFETYMPEITVDDGTNARQQDLNRTTSTLVPISKTRIVTGDNEEEQNEQKEETNDDGGKPKQQQPQQQDAATLYKNVKAIHDTQATNSNNQETAVSNLTTTTTTNNVSQDTRYSRTLSLIASLRGEMGNNLSVMAMARLVKRYVERHLPSVKVEILAEHQAANKWKTAKNDLQQCFISFRSLDFKAGIWDTDHDSVARLQKAWLATHMKRGGGEAMLQNILTRRQLAFLKTLLDQQAAGHPDAPPIQDPTNNATDSNNNNNKKYSLPYLQATGMIQKETLQDIDTYRDIRGYLKFDEQACCNLTAQPGESVLHYRNFIAELRKIRDEGMVEFSPNDTARYLFGPNKNNKSNSNINFTTAAADAAANAIDVYNPPPRRVAIIGRFRRQAGYNYAAALERQGWQVRVVMGQSGVQDFCFAMSTNAQLVGLSGSTYVLWAAILGNATVSRWYRVDIHAEPTLAQQTLLTTLDGRQFYEEVYGRTEVLSKAFLK